MMVADLMRAIAMFGCGVYVAEKVPVIHRHAETMAWFRRGRLRFDDVRRPLYWRSAAHAAAKLYIVVDLASRLGTDLTWRAPAAIAIFLLALWSLRVTTLSDNRALAAVRADPSLDPSVRR